MKPSESLAHPYDAEPYPILEAWPEFWWMSEWDRVVLQDQRARQYGGLGYFPRPDLEREYKR